MKTLSKTLIFGLFASLLVGFAAPALAQAPVLSATYQGGSTGSVQISISNANAYSSINLYSRQSSSLWTAVNNIGQTDGNGYFTQVVSMSSDGSGNPIQLYVTVGGLQSSTVSVYPNGSGYNNGCGTYGCNVGGMTLSQSSLSLTVGQSASVTANVPYPVYGSANNLYVSSNSNSSVASASASGNQITVYGLASGSTTISVCANSSGVCASLYVTVSGYNNGCGYSGCGVGGLTLSQSSLSLSVGQSSSVSASYPVYGYNNSFYVSSNSNSSVASASASGNQITVYGLASGSTTISVCANSSGVCASLYVTVSGTGNGCGYYGCSVGSLYLSQSSLSLSVGQSSTVTVSGNNSGGSVYISSNSNSSVASASVSGNQIYVYALASGSTTISVCQNNYGNSCVSLYVNVTGNIYSGNLYFNPSSLTLNAGQSSTVSISSNGNNYGSYYVSSNSNSSVASASISGSSLYVNALSAGSTSITVCQSSYGNSCATLYVTVTGVLGSNTNNIWFNPANPSMYVGQSLAVSINSSAYSTTYPYNSSTYYISSGGNTNVVSASIAGTVLNLYARQTGSTNITICSSALSFCGTLYVTVGSSSYYGSGSLSLNQTSLSITQGQSAIITANNAPALYVSSNSNPGTVAVSTVLNQATFYGQSNGSSTVILCGVNSGQCATVYVTINAYNNGTISLGQYALAMNIGQSATVNVSGNGGYGYYVAQNSNPGAVSASFNGSVLNVYGIAAGSSTLEICQNSANSCPSLKVTVGTGYPYNGSGYPYNNGGTGSGLQYPGGSSGVLGASAYSNGQLIAEGQTVYIVYNNTKTAFSSASVFLGLGFNFNNVLQVGNSGLASSSYTVTTQYASHPWGSWVKSGQTVYFVHESGLIPVPDWNTFLNNGGQASFIVPANTYDFHLPILSPMTSGDSRLQ